MLERETERALAPPKRGAAASGNPPQPGATLDSPSAGTGTTEDSDVLGVVLAGGRGERLYPLTKERSKAVVPFGGGCRLIDFALSNLANSGVRSVYVITQFKNAPLLAHLRRKWAALNGRAKLLVTALPGRVHHGEPWYRGTADAVYRNLRVVELTSPQSVAIFAADHVCRMDVRQMLAYHRRKQAALTVAAIPVPLEEAPRFGTVKIDPDWRIVGFFEKLANPPEIPGRPGWALASMGNYVFDAGVLAGELVRDAVDPLSTHDFGRDVIPRMLHRSAVYAYDFLTNRIPGEPPASRGYWTDVGTVQAYYQAHRDVLPRRPRFALWNPLWPFDSASTSAAAASEWEAAAGARIRNSIVSRDCVVGEAAISDSVLSPGVTVENGADVRESILLEGSHVEKGARIRRAILDTNTNVSAGSSIGYGPQVANGRAASQVVVIPSAEGDMKTALQPRAFQTGGEFRKVG